MAHRQRITEDSSVQMPNVRACSPFTAHREGETTVTAAVRSLGSAGGISEAAEPAA